MIVSDSYLQDAARYRAAGDRERAARAFRRYREQVNGIGVHDRLLFGSYNVCWNSEPSEITIHTPISWEVLRREGSRLLLVSEVCLEWLLVGNPSPDNCWYHAWIREYLNGMFYDRIFKPYEKEMVVVTEVTTGDNPRYGTKGGPDTLDRLFLLSAEEVEQYFDQSVSGARADILMAMDGYPEENHIELERFPHYWWLRTLGEDPEMNACVEADGSVNLSGRAADSDELGIRPAVWIDLSLFDPEK